MAINRPSAIDIDDEFAKATLHEIATGMGIELPAQTSGQLRLSCLFCDGENTKSYGSLVINLDHPANLFKAHCCDVKGNRLTLMYVWKYGTLPAGGSVRGDAYNEMVKLHRTVTGSLPEDSPPPQQFPKEQAATRTKSQRSSKTYRSRIRSGRISRLSQHFTKILSLIHSGWHRRQPNMSANESRG